MSSSACVEWYINRVECRPVSITQTSISTRPWEGGAPGAEAVAFLVNSNAHWWQWWSASVTYCLYSQIKMRLNRLISYPAIITFNLSLLQLILAETYVYQGQQHTCKSRQSLAFLVHGYCLLFQRKVRFHLVSEVCVGRKEENQFIPQKEARKSCHEEDWGGKHRPGHFLISWCCSYTYKDRHEPRQILNKTDSRQVGW